VIAFPQMVMVYKDDAPTVAPSSIEIQIPPPEAATDADRRERDDAAEIEKALKR